MGGALFIKKNVIILFLYALKSVANITSSAPIQHAIIKIPTIFVAYMCRDNFTPVMNAVKIHNSSQFVFSICNVDISVKVWNVCTGSSVTKKIWDH